MQMKRNRQFYWQLFMSTFKLSAFTFGGGYVIIPLMRQRFVEELGWIEEKEMLDLTAIAQSSPGAIAVNASILVGYRLAGFVGALITVFGTVLPPLVTLSAISLFYTQFRNSVIVNYALKGMQAGVVAVVADVILTLGKEILYRKEMISIFIMLISFVAASVFDMNVVLIILACGIIGAAMTLTRNYQPEARVIE